MDILTVIVKLGERASAIWVTVTRTTLPHSRGIGAILPSRSCFGRGPRTGYLQISPDTSRTAVTWRVTAIICSTHPVRKGDTATITISLQTERCDIMHVQMHDLLSCTPECLTKMECTHECITKMSCTHTGWCKGHRKWNAYANFLDFEGTTKTRSGKCAQRAPQFGKKI